MEARHKLPEFRVGQKILAEHSFKSRDDFDAALEEVMRPRTILERCEPMPLVLYLSDDVTVASLIEIVNKYGGLANDRIL